MRSTRSRRSGPCTNARDDRTIFADLAGRRGIEDDDDRTEEHWLRDLTKDAVDDFETFKEAGIARFAAPKDVVAFTDQIRDPDTHKFTTPSGNIEIYSLGWRPGPTASASGPCRRFRPGSTRSSPPGSTC